MSDSGPKLMSRRQSGSSLLLGAAIALASLNLTTPIPAHAARVAAKTEGPVMTNQEAWKLYEKYLAAWNTTSIKDRLQIASDVLSEKLEYQTARHDLSTGRAQAIEDMATFHERFPGGHFEIGDVSAHHNVAVLSWVIIQADGKEFARGIDMITVDRDGQISKITTFAPSVKNPT